MGLDLAAARRAGRGGPSRQPLLTPTQYYSRYIFLAIYTAEMIIKSVAKGFILNKYTYLRNPWNWLDFVVITSGYATIGMEVGNLAGLRTFRVLRALKTVSIMPGESVSRGAVGLGLRICAARCQWAIRGRVWQTGSV